MTTIIVSVLFHQKVTQPPLLHVVRSLYEEHVCVSPIEAIEIEALLHQERTLRITASIMKQQKA